jgi:hypothetical protein
VYLPDPSIAPWVTEFIEECAAFPNAYDDQVDAMSQALNRLRKSRSLDPEFFRACMDATFSLTESGMSGGDGSEMDRLPSEYPMGGSGGRKWSN